MVLALISMSAAAQYFQQTFNLDYTTPRFRNERLNGGVRTQFNYAPAPANYYFSGIGVSFIASTLDSASRVRFTRQSVTGGVLTNIAYDLADVNSPSRYWNAVGNSIAEVNNGQGTGGYVAVGSVSNNSITGVTCPGGSDWLWMRLKLGGSVVLTTRIDLGKGADTAWCVRASTFMPNTWIVCGESGHVIAGTNTNYKNAFVARVDIAGNVLWARTFNFDNTTANGISSYTVAKQLCENPATGNIYVVGTWQDVGIANTDGLIFSVNSTGNLLWQRTYNFGTDDEFQATRWSATGKLVVSGFTNGVQGLGTNMFLGLFDVATFLPVTQNILVENTVTGQHLDSKSYDVLERKNTQNQLEYYLIGPGYSGGTPLQTMYKANAAMVGVNWYQYNKMFYDVGFGIDMIDNSFAQPGIAYFSSWSNSSTGSHDSHTMHTYFNGAACTNLCSPIPPKTVLPDFSNTKENPVIDTSFRKVKLAAKITKYQSKTLCNQAAISCGVNSIMAVENAQAQQQIKIYPNPATNALNATVSLQHGGTSFIEVSDFSGNVVISKTITAVKGINTISLDVKNLHSGYYLLRIRNGKDEIKQPFMKE